jgi:hypothetical protein
VSPHGGMGIIPQAGLNRKKAWDSGPEKIKKPNFGLPCQCPLLAKADILRTVDLRPLYPRKRIFTTVLNYSIFHPDFF